MRSMAMMSALAVFAAAPLAAQAKFRTGEINPTSGQILGDVLGTQRDTAQHRRKSDHIPPGQMPPAGMCRVWIDGVPPGQQPAPTDCQTAVATKPANGRVIFGGDGTSFPGKGKGKFKEGKSGKHGERGIDREGDDDARGSVKRGDDDDHEDRAERRGRSGERDENRGRGSLLAKRGKKG